MTTNLSNIPIPMHRMHFTADIDVDVGARQNNAKKGFTWILTKICFSIIKLLGQLPVVTDYTQTFYGLWKVFQTNCNLLTMCFSNGAMHKYPAEYFFHNSFEWYKSLSSMSLLLWCFHTMSLDTPSLCELSLLISLKPLCRNEQRVA